MFRNPVLVRDATPDDSGPLCEVWSAVGKVAQDGHPAGDPSGAVAQIAADPDQRLLVAVLDDRVVGAVHLARATLSPVHGESTVRLSHLQVLEDYRRHGVGHALLEASVSWAEEKDTDYVLAAASANSRDANRFMARLGLCQVAVVRAAPVSTLRAKLPVEPPAAARATARSTRSTRTVGQVIAARRSQRRARARTS